MPRLERCIDGLLHERRVSPMPVGQHVAMGVRHDRLAESARANSLPADHDRDLPALAGHLRELLL